MKRETCENAPFLVWTGKNGDFENGDVKRHMPSVPVQIGASIQDGGWLAHAQFQVPIVSSFSSVLLWVGKIDMKTLVWFKIF